MSRFFDDEPDFDVVQEHEDRCPRPHLPHEHNGGISNEAYLNDYRNRMPFHYIEEGKDGYYYWQYGATMEIEFTITDEAAHTNEIPPYLVDVRVNGKSIVDEDTGIADIVHGSMADEDRNDYYTRTQVDRVVGEAVKRMNEALQKMNSLNKTIEKINRDLYSLAGPEYLMSRLVAGANISLQRDLTNPAEPKLRIASTGGGQTALFITEGKGSIEEPFVVTSPKEVSPKVFGESDISTLVFLNLPARGLKYRAYQQFYLSVNTGEEEPLIFTFTIVGAGMSSVKSGKLQNNLYSLVGSKLVDTFNNDQVKFITPTGENEYDVQEDMPFMFILTGQESITVNGQSFAEVSCSDVAGADKLSFSISELPTGVPFIGIYTATPEQALTISFSHLSPTYLEDVIAPLVDAKKVDADSIEFTEEGWPDDN